MPTNTINIPRSVRMRYFNGLFLQDQEFKTDQNFYIAMRRYLNFLLFDPGRLHLDDEVAPLQVSAAGMQVSVTPGSALIRDTATMSGYELEIPNLPVTDRQFDLSTESLSDGDTLTVTLQRDESDFISTGGGGAGVSPSEDDRTVERALLSVNLPGDPAPTPPFVTLATITAVDSSGGSGVADTLNRTNTTERGGVRLAILSEQVRAMLGGAGPGTATLTGISISPGGPLTITEGSTQTLVANGNFDNGTSHALTAGEGLNWNSSDPAVASVINGTVTGEGVGGPVTIRASVGAIEDSVTVNVVSAVPEPSFHPVTPFEPSSGRPANVACPAIRPATLVTIHGANFSVDAPTKPIITLIDVSGGLANVPVPDSLVNLISDTEITFLVPPIIGLSTTTDMFIQVQTSGGPSDTSTHPILSRFRCRTPLAC